jgi:hypothetical protein
MSAARGPSRVGSSLTRKCKTKLERIVTDKYFIILGVFISNEEKKFYNFDARCRFHTHFTSLTYKH